jgi:hypothetical protein
VSANRIPLELIENGFETENRRQQDFSTSPSASAPPPTPTKSDNWAISWDVWSSAADAAH